jgi:hypothetical protein
MRLSPRLRASFAAALVVGIASAAHSADSPEAQARRLDDHLFFVEKLNLGREPLLADIDRTLASLASAPAERVRPILVTADKAREMVARARLSDGTEKGESRALELFDLLARTALDDSRRPGFHVECAKILMKRADQAAAVNDDAHDASALDLANAALGHVPDYEPAFGMIARLGLKVGRALQQKEDYDTAVERLEGTLAALRHAKVKEGSKSLVDVGAVIAEIQRTTGPLTIAWLGDPQVLAAVRGGRTEFVGAALRFSGPGREPPQQSADKPRRVRTGTWQVTATGTGGGEPLSMNVTVTPQGGEIKLPRAVPDGMVVVPSAGADEWFLIDRTEVANAQWTALGGAPHGANPRAAAAGVAFAEAKDWAERNGKRLPTLAQWTHAAFGAPGAKSPRYPWGDEDGTPGKHFAAGVEEAQDASGFSAGESRSSHCLNMAGNVWEWLDTGWLIGGSYKNATFSRPVQPPESGTFEPWTADFLRDPLPPREAWEGLPPQDRERYFNYHASDSTLQQAGLRCVVPLGRPRR